ncbi:MAG: hypothetical protein R6V28_00505 [Nitriliruptoraceae bacterium]
MPTPRLLVATLLLTSALVLLACGTGDADGTGDDEVGEGTTDPVTDPAGDDDAAGDDDGQEGEEGATDRGTEASDSREVALAIADAARRTGLEEDEIELVELSMVTWPDGALGCPEPDTMYTQALVEGYRVVLDADGRQLVYHGAVGEDPFLCEDPQEPLEAEQD